MTEVISSFSLVKVSIQLDRVVEGFCSRISLNPKWATPNRVFGKAFDPSFLLHEVGIAAFIAVETEIFVNGL